MTPATPGDAVIRIGVAALFVLHGLILVLGLAKGLRFVILAHLTTPGSPAIGLLWLAAGLLCCAARDGNPGPSLGRQGLHPPARPIGLWSDSGPSAKSG